MHEDPHHGIGNSIQLQPVISYEQLSSGLQPVVEFADPTPPMPDSARQRCCCFVLSVIPLKISMRLMNEVSLLNGIRKRGFTAFDEPGSLQLAGLY